MKRILLALAVAAFLWPSASAAAGESSHAEQWALKAQRDPAFRDALAWEIVHRAQMQAPEFTDAEFDSQVERMAELRDSPVADAALALTAAVQKRQIAPERVELMFHLNESHHDGSTLLNVMRHTILTTAELSRISSEARMEDVAGRLEELFDNALRQKTDAPEPVLREPARPSGLGAVYALRDRARYSFDEKENRCRDGGNWPGLNRFTPVKGSVPHPCTDFRDLRLAYEKFRRADLRGSHFGNNVTYGIAFWILDSDLRSAKFEALAPGHGYSILNSDLRGADLSQVEMSFEEPDTHLTSLLVQLEGSKFDSTTKLPMLRGKTITPEQAVSSFGMVRMPDAGRLAAAPAGMPVEDVSAIRRIVADWDRAWTIFDAKLAAAHYTDGAWWRNAFGTRVIGRDKIEHILATLFKEPGIRSRRGTPSTVDIHFDPARPNEAVVDSYTEVSGQVHPDGSPMGTRRINDVRVFHKIDGTWRIFHHQIADALPKEPGRDKPPQ